MVLNVEIYVFMMKSFAPNRKGDSCQEMIGQYLKGLSIGEQLSANCNVLIEL